MVDPNDISYEEIPEEEILPMDPATIEAEGIEDAPAMSADEDWSLPAPYVEHLTANADLAADVINMAGAGTVPRIYSGEDFVNAYMPSFGRDEVGELLASIEAEDADVQKATIYTALQRTDIDAQGKLALTEALLERQWDMNVIQRQALHNANLYENDGDTEEDQENLEVGAAQAEAIPRGEPDTRDVKHDLGIPTDNPALAKEMLEALVNELYERADEGATLLNEGPGKLAQITGLPIPRSALDINWRGAGQFAATMLPFNDTAWIAEIQTELGLDSDLILDVGGKIAPGTAWRMTAEYIQGLGPVERLEALNKVVKVLKNNSHLFKDGNDYVTMYTLARLFPEELGGSYSSPSEMPAHVQAKIDALKQEYWNTKGFGSGPKRREITRQIKELTDEYGAPTITFTEFFENAGNILDIVGLGSLVRKPATALTRRGIDALRKLNKSAPRAASEAMANAVLDPAVRAKYGELYGEDIVEALFPRASSGAVTEAVDGMSAVLKRHQDVLEELRAITNDTNLVRAERQRAVQELSDMWRETLSAPKSYTNFAHSVVEPTDTGVRVAAAFGRKDGSPFGTLKSAQAASREAMERIFGKDVKSRILMIDDSTGKLVDVPAGMSPTTKGRFFHVVEDERRLESARGVMHDLTLGDTDIDTAWLGPAWNTYKATYDQFSKTVADAIGMKAGQKAAWNRVSAALLESTINLGKKDQAALSALLRKGEKADPTTGMGKVFKPSELAAMRVDKKVQKAYYESRSAMDIMHSFVNDINRTRLLREGAEDIHGPSGRVGFGVVRKDAGQAIADIPTGSGSLSVFDATAGVYKKMSPTDITALYNGGGRVARLKSVLFNGADEATHVIVDGKNVKGYGIPKTVVPKVEGYIPHIWDGNFIVYGITNSGNKVAIGIAKSHADARKGVERLRKIATTRKEKGKSVQFEPENIHYDLDRSLKDPSKAGAFTDDIYTNMRGPVFGARNGGALVNLSKDFGDSLVDPIEGMMRAMEIIGHQVTKGELVENMYTKLYNYAKSKGVLRDPRIAPNRLTADSFNIPAGKGDVKTQIEAYLKQIELVRRTPDAVDQAMSKFYLELGHAIDKIGQLMGGKLGKLTSWADAKISGWAARGHDPVATAMGLLHRTVIASAPIAQHALQLSQLSLMLGVAPRDMPQAVARMHAVWALLMKREQQLSPQSPMWRFMAGDVSTFKKDVKHFSKVFGIPEDELTNIVEVIARSGLVDSVSVHTAMRSATRAAAQERMLASASTLNKGLLSRAMGAVGRIADMPFQAGSSLGFEAGEAINRVGTFLALYSKSKRELGAAANLADPDFVRSIIGDVYKYTGSMLPEMSFNYQRGWLKAFFQFASFQHKMLNLMTLDKGLSAKQKAMLIATQVAVFGRRGTAISDALYRVIDAKVNAAAAEAEPGSPESMIVEAWRDPSVQERLNGGLTDWLANAGLQAAFGEHIGHYEFSARFAPGGGHELLVDRLAALGHMDVYGMLGLAGEKGSKFYDYLRLQASYLQAQALGGDPVPYPERLKNAVDQGAQLMFSQYGRMAAARIANAHYGWVASNGRLSESYHGAIEQYLYGMFGVEEGDRAALWDAIEKEEALLRKTEYSKSSLDKMVDIYFKDMVYQSSKLVSQGVSDEIHDNMMDRWLAQHAFLFSVFEPQEAQYISDKMVERLSKMAESEDTAEQAFIRRLAKPLIEGKFGQEGPEFIESLKTNGILQRHPRLMQIIMEEYANAVDSDHFAGETE